jgi:hypothetical protein
MRVQRVVTFLLMIALTVVSGSSLAAAMCAHGDAQAHAAALRNGDADIANAAHLEDSKASSGSRRTMPVDAGAFSLPTFILPAPLAASDPTAAEPMPVGHRDARLAAQASVAPPLRPPAA